MAKRAYDWAKDAIASDDKIDYFHFGLPAYTVDTEKAYAESLSLEERSFFYIY
jgi:hypothetical protein